MGDSMTADERTVSVVDVPVFGIHGFFLGIKKALGWVLSLVFGLI
tara:strand:+ start:676 stop:810 length:135 start_codon:yes stop_codon:yes gene_type:complete